MSRKLVNSRIIQAWCVDMGVSPEEAADIAGTVSLRFGLRPLTEDTAVDVIDYVRFRIAHAQ